MTSDTALQCVDPLLNGDLPEGWVSASLPEIAHIQMGQSPPGSTYNTDGDGLPFFQGKAEFGDLYPALAKWCTAPSRIVERDAMLLSVRAPVGPTNLAPCRSAIGRGLAGITPRGDLPPAYLLHYLRLTEQGLVAKGAGSTFEAITKEEVYGIEVSFSPAAEQERIVKAVERLTARVDAARERLANVPKILKRFRQTVLAAACSGRLTEDWRESHSSTRTAFELLQILESRSSKTARTRLGSAVEPDATLELPTGWVWSPLNVLCDEIVDCPHSTPKWTDSGRLCVRTTNFKPGYLDLSSKRFVSDDTFRERISRLRPEPGDLLYSREGGILGIACLIPPKTQLCLGQRMMLIRAWPEVSAPYVMHCLNSSIVLQCIRDLTGGTASPHLNVGDIKQFQIPLPPTTEQQEIVRRVDALMKLADAIERRVVAATARADKVTQAVLAKAFRGELVPTEAEVARAEGRTYETAAELLARVVASTTANETPQRRRTRRKRA